MLRKWSNALKEDEDMLLTPQKREDRSRLNYNTILTKRILILSILLSLLFLGYLGMQSPNTSRRKELTLWTEQNTKYPFIPSHLPPGDQIHTMTHFSRDIEEIKLLDKEWRSLMHDSEIIGIDFDFNKGFSEKYRVLFENNFIALVCFIFFLSAMYIN